MRREGDSLHSSDYVAHKILFFKQIERDPQWTTKVLSSKQFCTYEVQTLYQKEVILLFQNVTKHET